jgi:hypothetical protein
MPPEHPAHDRGTDAAGPERPDRVARPELAAVPNPGVDPEPETVRHVAEPTATFPEARPASRTEGTVAQSGVNPVAPGPVPNADEIRTGPPIGEPHQDLPPPPPAAGSPPAPDPDDNVARTQTQAVAQDSQAPQREQQQPASEAPRAPARSDAEHPRAPEAPRWHQPPSRTPPGTPFEAPAQDDRDSGVNVSIGQVTVEFLPPPAPPPSPRPAGAPVRTRGFDEYARARRGRPR